MIPFLILTAIAVIACGVFWLYGYDAGYKACAKFFDDEERRHKIVQEFREKHENQNQLKTEKPERAHSEMGL